ncbi:MAG: amino acid ABC transporter substrate-binding protein [Thermogemmatispora sp.]|jgi:branched-chain amino acid transport system substrate-binding protein|uniref:Branched-chain amino acid ABC transporter substrate-binding protein n=1 Tax=Thermogemmatispora aurantia TaxID=2045279 RepID=A0A5J4K5R8_9CHLR|nr:MULTISPECIES: amino acid ABC transporter substrate-binding protein [Thermogemmatispora]MBE3566136.1 amino acid ABC transporter substrate-binding protein [Thermogemmatispora sp.]GER82875.1 branched-chain amino acid ABC transporter substrate-binding protein [Thermogemmatispora aurantia]
MKSFRLFITTTVLLVLILTGCSAAQNAGSSTSSSNGLPPAGQPIVIGGTLGLTGAYAGPSADYKATYDYWLQQVNSHGGLLGHPVKMIIYDDESNPATAQSLYQRLIHQDKVNLLLSPYTTAIGGAVLPIAAANHMILWNGGFVGIKLFKSTQWMIGSYTYQEPDYSRGVFEMIDSLPASERPTRVGIVTEQNPFTLVVRDGYQGQGGVINFARQRGMQIVLNEEYPPTATDVSGLIQRAKAAKVDLFFALSLPNPAALIARTAYSLGFKPKIYCACGSLVTSLPYWAQLGPAGEGIFSTAMAVPSDNYDGIKDLFAMLQQVRHETVFSQYAAVAMTILQVMQQAVEGARTLDQQQLRAYVLSHRFNTVNGPLTFDQYGMPHYNAVLVQYLNGKNEVVWPPSRATAKPQLQ